MSVNYNFSADEDEAFKEFKKRFLGQLEDNDENDFHLYRFLKEQKFHVDKAESMLKKVGDHLEYRQKMKLDSILEDYVNKEPLASYFPYNMLSFDIDSPIVVLVDVGNCDAIGLLKSVKREDLVKHILYFFEDVLKKLWEQTLKCKKPTSAIYILDLENIQLFTLTNKTALEVAMELLLVIESNYPEQVAAAYVINVPTFFHHAYNLVKRTLAERSLRKVSIYGKDQWNPKILKSFFPEILKPVSLEIIPAYLGGQKTDPDGNKECVATLKRGKIVPKHYYFGILDYQLRNQIDVKRYILKPRSKINIAHNVDVPGSIIEWQLESEGHDIGFGILYKLKDGKDQKELIPIQRISANLQREIGNIMIELPGTYTIVLDNSYSWLRGKHIFIKSTVKKPENPEKKESGFILS